MGAAPSHTALPTTEDDHHDAEAATSTDAEADTGVPDYQDEVPLTDEIAPSDVEYVSEFVKLNAVYGVPERIYHRELASAQQDITDLTDLLLAHEYRAHDLPTVAAAFALVSNAYGMLINPVEVESRLPQPASIDEVAGFLGMKTYPVFARAEYVRYYINTKIPVVMCVFVPTEWLLDDSGNARALDNNHPGYAETTLICCVAFKHSARLNQFGIAFDKEGEVHFRYVDDDIIEHHSRDLVLLDTDVRPKMLKKRYIRIREAAA